jgi:hypothetical protein
MIIITLANITNMVCSLFLLLFSGGGGGGLEPPTFEL